MNRRKLILLSSMALVLIGVSSTSQAEDGSLRLRTMFAERGFGVGVDEAAKKGTKIGIREKSLMNNDELFLNFIETKEDKNS